MAARDRIEREIEANQALDSLMRMIVEDDNPHKARELLRDLAARLPPEEMSGSEEAFRLYHGMKSALDEEEFRWAAMAMPFVDSEPDRRERLRQYRRHRELFELEIKLALRLRRSKMSLNSDWSGMGAYLSDAWTMSKARASLKIAELLFRMKMPGAQDVCEATASILLKQAYFAA